MKESDNSNYALIDTLKLELIADKNDETNKTYLLISRIFVAIETGTNRIFLTYNAYQTDNDKVTATQLFTAEIDLEEHQSNLV